MLLIGAGGIDWLLEDPLVRPKEWLRTDMDPPFSFLKCDPALTPDGSGYST